MCLGFEPRWSCLDLLEKYPCPHPSMWLGDDVNGSLSSLISTWATGCTLFTKMAMAEISCSTHIFYDLSFKRLYLIEWFNITNTPVPTLFKHSANLLNVGPESSRWCVSELKGPLKGWTVHTKTLIFSHIGRQGSLVRGLSNFNIYEGYQYHDNVSFDVGYI